MPYRDLSSLDRFVNLRAPSLSDVTGQARDPLRWVLSLFERTVVGLVALLVFATLGCGLVLLAVVLAATLIDAGGAGHLVGLTAAAAGLVFVCSSVGAYVLGEWPSARSMPHTDTRLSREARGLLHGLIHHIEGWPPPHGQQRRFRDATTRGLFRTRHDRRCQDLLGPEAFELLNAAAREYNRIAGALTAEGSRGNAVLEGRASEIRAAIDEAMADVLHAAAHVNRLPENDAPWTCLAGSRVDELRELADHVQRLRAVEEHRAELPAGPSRIQRLLDELRADELARAELDGGTNE